MNHWVRKHLLQYVIYSILTILSRIILIVRQSIRISSVTKRVLTPILLLRWLEYVLPRYRFFHLVNLSCIIVYAVDKQFQFFSINIFLFFSTFFIIYKYLFSEPKPTNEKTCKTKQFFHVQYMNIFKFLQNKVLRTLHQFIISFHNSGVQYKYLIINI